ncbi:transposase family protein [Streptomyces sp. TG1A-60]|uniref:helix-turn-helix domain-containing protein n=1 Tax=Streptomyces sp. TG1A-60 TaxID=3129111 RepID=UPI0030CEF0C4
MYHRTNLTMRQLAPLFGVSPATVCRLIQRLSPLLALDLAGPPGRAPNACGSWTAPSYRCGAARPARPRLRGCLTWQVLRASCGSSGQWPWPGFGSSGRCGPRTGS